MKTKLLMLSIAMSCTLAGNAMAVTMSKQEYKTQGDQISAGYKVNINKCGDMSGNAKDICKAEAKGADKVARAELEAQYRPSPAHDRDVAMARADAAYDTAKEKCDDLSGNSKDVCVKEAKAGQVKARENAKVAMTTATVNSDNNSKVASARSTAASEKRNADYEVARAKCDALAGAAKDTCQSSAKTKFGMQ